MKILVAYFSKTGNTKKVAEKIALNLEADLDEIIDKDGKSEEKMFKKEPVEIEYKQDPAGYDLVVIGSPVWGFNLPPVIKNYLEKNKFNRVAFFCTFGLWRGLIFSRMKKLAKPPIATLGVHMKKVDSSEGEISDFCAMLKT